MWGVDMYGYVEACLYSGLFEEVYVCIFDWVYEGYAFHCMYVHTCIGSAVEYIGVCPYMGVSTQWWGCVHIYMYVFEMQGAVWIYIYIQVYLHRHRCEESTSVCVWRACVCFVVV